LIEVNRKIILISKERNNFDCEGFNINNKIRILHLEDNKNDAELIKAMLKSDGLDCTILLADNREDFLKIIDENIVDLILADYSLPSFDGLSALKLVRELNLDIPFILISAVLKEELAIEALHRGATDYISKSRLERLSPSIKRVIQEIKEKEQRKKLEEDISKHEERYHKIASRVRGFLKMELPSGKYSLVDKYLSDLSGYSADDWYQIPNFIQKIIHPDFLEYYRENYKRMQKGIVPNTMEYKIIREDGQERWWIQFNLGAYDIEQKLVSISIIIIDNTEIKDSQLKYQHLFENAIVGIFRTNIKTGQIIDANNTIVEIFGYDSIEELKKHRTKLLYQNEELRNAFLNILKKDGYVLGYKVKMKKKDGTVIWVSLSGKLYQKEGYTEGFLIDISEQKKAEEAQRVSEEKYRGLFQETPIGILTCDNNGIIQSVNKTALVILGSPSEEATKEINLLTFPLLVKAGASDDLKNCLRTGKHVQKEKEYITKWGKEIVLLYKIFPMKDQEGNIIGAMSTFEDVSERKQTEKLLLESERSYRLLAENITDVIFTLNLNMEITYINPAVEDLIGFTDKEVLTKTLDELLTSKSLELAFEVLSEELEIEEAEDKDLSRSRMIDLEFIHKNGSPILVEAKVTFQRDNNDKATGLLGVLRDLSRRKSFK